MYKTARVKEKVKDSGYIVESYPKKKENENEGTLDGEIASASAKME
jgi:hypothetical protein